MCNVKSPHWQHVPWNLFCLSVVLGIDILNVLGFLCHTLFACCPFELLVIRTGGMTVMALWAPVYMCVLGVSLLPYHLGTIPAFRSHLKTRSGNWIMCR